MVPTAGFLLLTVRIIKLLLIIMPVMMPTCAIYFPELWGSPTLMGVFVPSFYQVQLCVSSDILWNVCFIFFSFFFVFIFSPFFLFPLFSFFHFSFFAFFLSRHFSQFSVLFPQFFHAFPAVFPCFPLFSFSLVFFSLLSCLVSCLFSLFSLSSFAPKEAQYSAQREKKILF